MKVFIECELKDVLIGAPILEAKQGVRTSDSYATFPNDYEGERIFLQHYELPTEEEIEEILFKCRPSIPKATKAITNLLKGER